MNLVIPLVLKPVDGVGCGGLSIIKEEVQVKKAIEKVKADSNATRFVVQQFIDGEPASVSLLSNDKKAMALSLNKQSITLAEPNETSSYDGGCVPFNHPLKQEALSLAEKVVESFSGLRGYVGVDLVLGKDEPYVVDVNPRLTTSYVGLSKVANFNVAEALINSVIKGQLPSKTMKIKVLPVSQKSKHLLHLPSLSKKPRSQATLFRRPFHWMKKPNHAPL